MSLEKKSKNILRDAFGWWLETRMITFAELVCNVTIQNRRSALFWFWLVCATPLPFRGKEFIARQKCAFLLWNLWAICLPSPLFLLILLSLASRSLVQPALIRTRPVWQKKHLLSSIRSSNCIYLPPAPPPRRHSMIIFKEKLRRTTFTKFKINTHHFWWWQMADKLAYI